MWLGSDWLRRGAAVLVLAAAACGDDGPSGYGPDHRAGFVDECTTGDVSEQACGCFYDRLAAEVPFERFETLEDAPGDEALPPDIAALAAACVANPDAAG